MARVFLTAWLCLGLLSALWSVATPISAAPDEPAHLIKAAAVAHGELLGEPGEHGHQVLVPEAIAFSHAQTCFAFNTQVHAGCAPASPTGTVLVESGTTAGLYNPLYYALVGWPSLVLEGPAAIYAMRIASALLTSALLALGVMLIAGWRHRALPALGMLAATTPLAVFIGGVVNPSGPEIAGTLTAAIAAFSLARRPDEARTRERVIVLAIAASVAMNMRGISPLWVALAVLLPLALARRTELLELFRSRTVVTAAAFTAAAGALALIWTALTNSLGAAIEGGEIETDYPGVGTPAPVAFFTVIGRTVGYGRGAAAEFGWADTVGSATTLFALATLIGSLLLAGCVLLRRRELAVFLAAVGALILLPALIQASYVTQGGYIWQGRYAAPMLAVVLFLTAALIGEALPERTWPQLATRLLAVGTALWGLAQLDSFVLVLGRYAVGLPIAWREFLLAPGWQPPGGVLLLCTIAALTVTLICVQVVRYGRSGAVFGAGSLSSDTEARSPIK